MTFTVAIVVVLTWMFNSTGGSVLLVTLYYASQNAWANLRLHVGLVQLDGEGALPDVDQMHGALALRLWCRTGRGAQGRQSLPVGRGVPHPGMR